MPIIKAPMSTRTQFTILLCFFVTAFFLRLPTMFRSVLDWDESLYLIMALQWLHGHLPYTTVWDNKPIGIYAIFALFKAVCGNGLVAIRLATVVFVSATAFFVFKIIVFLGEKRGHSGALYGVTGGIIYLIASLSNDGLAANTELFMSSFTTLAMLTALTPHIFTTRRYLVGLVSGLCFGLAVMTKYVAVFEAPAIGFALLWMNKRKDWLTLTFCTVIGSFIPAIVTILLYASTGHLEIWWQDSVASNFIRVAAHVPPANMDYTITTQLRRWLPFYISPIILLSLIFKVQDKKPILYLSIWLIGGTLGVCAAKSFFDHYFLQILPVSSISLAYLLMSSPVIVRVGLTLLVGFPLVAGESALHDALQPVLRFHQGKLELQKDTPTRIADDLNAAKRPGQVVYVFDDQPIVYVLIHQDPPTKYVLPSVLTKCFLPLVAGINASAEMARILNTEPEYIVRSLQSKSQTEINQNVYFLENRVIAANYHLWKEYNTSQVFQLNEHPNDALVNKTIPIDVTNPCGLTSGNF